MSQVLKTEEDLLQLRRGDIIQHKYSGNSYVVLDQVGRSLIAVDTIEVTNPDEWLALTIDGKRV